MREESAAKIALIHDEAVRVKAEAELKVHIATEKLKKSNRKHKEECRQLEEALRKLDEEIKEERNAMMEDDFTEEEKNVNGVVQEGHVLLSELLRLLVGSNLEMKTYLENISKSTNIDKIGARIEKIDDMKKTTKNALAQVASFALNQVLRQIKGGEPDHPGVLKAVMGLTGSWDTPLGEAIKHFRADTTDPALSVLCATYRNLRAMKLEVSAILSIFCVYIFFYVSVFFVLWN